MMTDDVPSFGSKANPATDPAASPRKKVLSPAAERALAEAEARRVAARNLESQPSAREIAGPEGPEPTRYGDWEKKGIASDF